jgi:hypothetical protein
MARSFFVLLTLSLLFSACTQRMICPAYQSAFIYDKNELRKKFSYFEEDSTPKILVASKNKYLIAEPMSYRKKLRLMHTVAMKPVNPVLPDSMTVDDEELDEEIDGEDGVVPGAELDLAARSVIDSTYIIDVPVDTTQTYVDSVYVITKDKELRLLKYNFPDSLKFDESSGRYVSETPEYGVSDIRYNVEQDNYMWYLRNSLVLPDVRLSQLQQSAQKEMEGKSSKASKKKGFLGFFKNLFKKKEKVPTDTTEQQVPTKPADDFDYIENDSIRQHQQDSIRAAQPPEKKGAFSFLKKKKKDDAANGEAEPDEQKPKKKRKEEEPKEDVVLPPKDEPIIEDEEETDSF